MASGFFISLKIETDGDREELIKNLSDYFTNPEAPLLTDYGPKAWGGYDGPVISGIEVSNVVRWSDVPGPSDAEVDAEGMELRKSRFEKVVEDELGDF